MAPKAPPPPAAAEADPELPDGVYRKEISEEQLSGFYEAAYTSHEDMLKFLADVLGLRDISYKARNAIIVDYFSGFLLIFIWLGSNVESQWRAGLRKRLG